MPAARPRTGGDVPDHGAGLALPRANAPVTDRGRAAHCRVFAAGFDVGQRPRSVRYSHFARRNTAYRPPQMPSVTRIITG